MPNEVTLEGWIDHDENWLRRQEQMDCGMWLLCFFAKPGTLEVLQGCTGWVKVLSRKWVPGAHHKSDLDVEVFKLHNAGLLEVEMLAHEMRDKYNSP